MVAFLLGIPPTPVHGPRGKWASTRGNGSQMVSFQTGGLHQMVFFSPQIPVKAHIVLYKINKEIKIKNKSLIRIITNWVKVLLVFLFVCCCRHHTTVILLTVHQQGKENLNIHLRDSKIHGK